MSNFTLQYIANTGYKIIKESIVSVDGSAAMQIPAEVGTNMIRVFQVSSARKCAIGSAAMANDGSDGVPLYLIGQYWTGLAAQEYYSPIVVEYLTSQPDLYYVAANAGANIVVQYLSII